MPSHAAGHPAFAAPSAVALFRPRPVLAMSPRTRPHSPPPSTMPPTRATIAVPSDPARASPESEEHPEPTSVPWMPLPGLVHSIQTPEQFDRLSQVAVEEQKLLVVDFMAAWCRKCMYLLPQLRKIGRGRDDVYFCSVDVNKVRRLPKEFGIEKMPTFVFLRGGERVDTLVAGMAPDKASRVLRERVDKLAASG